MNMFSLNMYSLLDKYIARHVISASLLILFLLVVLRAMFALLEESSDIGKGSYGTADAFLYVALMLPQKLLELFPMGVLIGSLFGLGILASNNELTVMRASGVTTWRIAFSCLKASLVLMIIVLFISELIAPAASKSAQQLRTTAMSDGKITHSKTGLWAKRDNQIIQISSIKQNGEMRAIHLFELDSSYQISQLVEADRARIIDGQWFLFDVLKTKFLGERIEKTKVDKMQWKNPLDEENLESLTLSHETLNLIGLVKYENYLSSNRLDSSEVALSIWQRAMLPLSIAIMMFLASSFAFGPMRDVSMGARILSGVMLGFGFHLAKQSFGPISLIYGASPALGAIAPLFVFALFAFWLMKKSS